MYCNFCNKQIAAADYIDILFKKFHIDYDEVGNRVPITASCFAKSPQGKKVFKQIAEANGH
jgi:hypothetical protein